MKQILLSAAISASLIAPVSAGQLYKIIDANGNATYSQLPPASESDGAKVESISVKGDAVSQITRSGSDAYCGDIRLPSKSDRSYRRDNELRFARRVDDRRQDWQRMLKRLEANSVKRSERKFARSSSRSRYSSRSSGTDYYDHQQSAVSKMRDLRCALAWSNSALDDTSHLVEQQAGERERLLGIRDELKDKLATRCGDLPQYDPTDPQAKQGRAKWYKCSGQYRKDLKQVDRRLGQID